MAYNWPSSHKAGTTSTDAATDRIDLARADIQQNIVNVNEKFLFSVSSDGVYQQTSTFESEGFLVLAAADFFTAERKQFVGELSIPSSSHCFIN